MLSYDKLVTLSHSSKTKTAIKTLLLPNQKIRSSSFIRPASWIMIGVRVLKFPTRSLVLKYALEHNLAPSHDPKSWPDAVMGPHQRKSRFHRWQTPGEKLRENYMAGRPFFVTRFQRRLLSGRTRAVNRLWNLACRKLWLESSADLYPYSFPFTRCEYARL